MPSESGHLYVGFWSIGLRNLPIGIIRHGMIDARMAKGLITTARADGLLRCGSVKDIFAPYSARERRRHEAMCEVLTNHLGIAVGIDDFSTGEEDGLSFTFPLDLIQLGGADQMLVIDCNFEFLRSDGMQDFDLRFKIVPGSIKFHLLQAIDVAGEQVTALPGNKNTQIYAPQHQEGETHDPVKKPRP